MASISNSQNLYVYTLNSWIQVAIYNGNFQTIVMVVAATTTSIPITTALELQLKAFETISPIYINLSNSPHRAFLAAAVNFPLSHAKPYTRRVDGFAILAYIPQHLTLPIYGLRAPGTSKQCWR